MVREVNASQYFAQDATRFEPDALLLVVDKIVVRIAVLGHQGMTENASVAEMVHHAKSHIAVEKLGFRAGKMRAHKVRSSKNVVVVIDGDDHVANLLVRVQDADVATLDTPPRQVRIEFGVLQAHETEKLAAANGHKPWTCTLSGPPHP